MIPPIFKYTGDKAAGAKLRGLGRKRLNTLKRDMGFQDIETYNDTPLLLGDGSTIRCTSSQGRDVIEIHVPARNKTDQFDENVKPLDNRFFVRIGKESDIQYDGFGRVISDNTRYYWIDFFAYPNKTGADKIDFYYPGKKYEKKYGGKTYRDIARNVSDETFLQAITMLDYMFYNYVSSFDLKNNNDSPIEIRFVAGYNFLATGDEIIYEPSVPLPSGGEIDMSGTTKNPPNRFMVDTESKTLCFYHVLQNWPVTASYTLSTGSMSGTIIGIDFTSNSKYRLNAVGTFSITGAMSEYYGVETSGSSGVLEPNGIASDIISLGRDNIVINIPHYSAPVEMTINSRTGEITSCSGKTSLQTSLISETGYSWYQSSTYRFSSGTPINIALEDTLVENTYTVTDCDAITDANECWDVEPQLQIERTQYEEAGYNWEDYTVSLSVDGIASNAFSIVTNGEGNCHKYESVYCQVHTCSVGMYIACGHFGGVRQSAKALNGSVSGSFGGIQSAKIPCHNVSILYWTHSVVSETVIERYVQGPEGGYTETFSDAVASWGVSQPCLTSDPVGQYFTTAYPQNYPIEDPANWFNVGHLPGGLPALLFDNSVVPSWYGPAIPDADYTTEHDLCVVKGCPDTFTASAIQTITILDDRKSFGSQGIAIAVKSTIQGETAVYHDGVNKTNDIIAAMIRNKMLRANEMFLDIGLI